MPIVATPKTLSRFGSGNNPMAFRTTIDEQIVLAFSKQTIANTVTKLVRMLDGSARCFTVEFVALEPFNRVRERVGIVIRIRLHANEARHPRAALEIRHQALTMVPNVLREDRVLIVFHFGSTSISQRVVWPTPPLIEAKDVGQPEDYTTRAHVE
jgi:hypothetical protein